MRALQGFYERFSGFLLSYCLSRVGFSVLGGSTYEV